MSNPLYDGISLHILNELSLKTAMRYIDLKEKLEVSDSSLTKRLTELRSMNMINVEARTNEKGRNFIVYVLTPDGEKVVKELDIRNWIKKVSAYALA